MDKSTDIFTVEYQISSNELYETIHYPNGKVCHAIAIGTSKYNDTHVVVKILAVNLADVNRLSVRRWFDTDEQ